jgi:LysM repeat protein
VPPPATPTPAGTVYTVKEGDTISAIAVGNNSTVDAIAKANNLSDPNKIQIGQKLIVPPAEPASSVAAASGEAAAPASAASPGASGSAASPPASAKPNAAPKPPPP